ncbi:DHA2 family efflux MFS transporter permease subunit [Pseudonocardia lacus]|uniref:DHA2 family efflux MFS transporter permease subunit n=1 Tax=Pseudonocardia lacus TaxID=2835865 RepID=UPI0027E274F3|nr:DHA2 family efflux MFS transporter permease subunit [Pseudonocardia lacus]
MSAPDRFGPALRRMIAVVLLGGIMGILDGSMVLVAVRTIADDLDASPGAVGWAATAYLLAVVTTVPVGAWAADRYGGKRLWLVGLVVFFAGSLGSALAPGLGALVASRVLQGVGAGVLDPLMLTLLARAAGPARAGRVMGIMGIVGSAGPVAGPVLGGALLQALDWRWLFLVNIPIVVAAFALAVRVLAPDAPAGRTPGPRLDVLGVALVGPGVSAVVLGLSRIEQEHTALAWSVLVPLGLATALLGGYTAHALRRTAPLVDLRLLARPGVAASLLAAGTNGLATFAALFGLPLFFQQVHGATPTAAGLLLAPLGAASMLAMPVSGRLSDRLGSRRVAVAGGVVALAAAVLLAVQPGSGDAAVAVLGTAVLGLGLGAVGAPAIGAVFRTVPPESAAQGSALLYMVNQLGAALGIATTALLVGTAPATGATTAEFRPAFWLLAAGVLVGIAAGAALPGRPRPAPVAA